MENVKTLYVSDLDGTLLGADSQLSPESVDMLNEAIDRYGALFTCATARTPATIQPLMQRVHVPLPMIAMAGAAMWNAATGLYEHVRTIPEEVIGQVLAACRRHGVEPFVYRDHNGVIEAFHGTRITELDRAFIEPRSHSPYKRFVIDDCYGMGGDAAMLVFMADDYSRLERVNAEIEGQVCCTAMFYHDIFDASVGNLEVYSRGTTKALAVQQLASEVGATRIVTFGDNRNDMPMMRVATHSVAVENAVPEVREMAHEVIGPNTAHSVAQWILRDAQTIYGLNNR